MKDLQHNKAVALLFWNPKSREQLRVKAVADVVGVDDDESADGGVEERAEATKLWEKHWAKVPDHAKRDYATVEAPGTVILDGPDGLGDDGEGIETDTHLALAKQHFRVVRVVAMEMDYLRLDRTGHERKGFVWKASAGWQAQSLVP